MAVVVVRIGRQRAEAPAREEEAREQRGAPARATAASLGAAAAGVAIVLSSMLGGPLWLRIALIAAGALLGLAGLAALAAEVVRDAARGEAARPAAPTWRWVAGRPARRPG